MNNETVNHPNHYTTKSMESIEVIRVMTENLKPFDAYCIGNALKYLYRFENKNGQEDLKKAKKYIEFMLEEER